MEHTRLNEEIQGLKDEKKKIPKCTGRKNEKETQSLEGIFPSSAQLSSTFFTANSVRYVGGSDTASQFRRRSASDFEQHFGTE